MLRLLKAGELLLYLAACCYGGYRGWMELRISQTETAPAAFTASDFAARHRGEQWVRVTGRAAVEHRHVQPSPYQPHRGKNLAYVTTPFVPPDWTSDQPVHVLATFGPVPMWNVDAWAASASATTHVVQGQLRPNGFRDPQSMFPRLQVSSGVVVINEGTQPNHAGAMIGFLTLMIVFGIALTLRLRSVMRDGTL